MCIYGVIINDRECGMNIFINKKGYFYFKFFKDGM